MKDLVEGKVTSHPLRGFLRNLLRKHKWWNSLLVKLYAKGLQLKLNFTTDVFSGIF